MFEVKLLDLSCRQGNDVVGKGYLVNPRQVRGLATRRTYSTYLVMGLRAKIDGRQDKFPDFVTDFVSHLGLPRASTFLLRNPFSSI